MTGIEFPRSTNEYKDDFDDATVARIERNIDGAFDLLAKVIDDPSIADRIPDGAQIILEYEDDPDLSAANRRAGWVARRPVYVHRVANGA